MDRISISYPKKSNTSEVISKKKDSNLSEIGNTKKNLPQLNLSFDATSLKSPPISARMQELNINAADFKEEGYESDASQESDFDEPHNEQSEIINNLSSAHSSPGVKAWGITRTTSSTFQAAYGQLEKSSSKTGSFGEIRRGITPKGQKVVVKAMNVNFLRGNTPNQKLRCAANEAFAQQMSADIGASPSIQGIGYFDDRFAMAMEEVEGKDLSEYTKLGPMPENIVKKIIFVLLHHIKNNHQIGNYHLDLKPANVIVAEEFQESLVIKANQINPKSIQLIDWGEHLSKKTEAEASPRLTEVRGSRTYMHPALMGMEEGESISARLADLYPIGVIAAELLNGRTPKVDELGSDWDMPEKSSSDAKGFINSITHELVHDLTHDLTAEQALNHSWFAGLSLASVENKNA